MRPRSLAQLRITRCVRAFRPLTTTGMSKISFGIHPQNAIHYTPSPPQKQDGAGTFPPRQTSGIYSIVSHRLHSNAAIYTGRYITPFSTFRSLVCKMTGTSLCIWYFDMDYITLPQLNLREIAPFRDYRKRYSAQFRDYTKLYARKRQNNGIFNQNTQYKSN